MQPEALHACTSACPMLILGCGNTDSRDLDQTSLQAFFIEFYNDWRSLAYLVFILLGTLAITFVIHLVLRKRYARPGVSHHIWRDAIVGALDAPLQCAVWIVGLSVAAATVTTGGRMPLLAQIFPPVRDAVAIAIGAWFLFRLSRRIRINFHARMIAQGQVFDATTADAIGKLATALIVIVAVLVTMQTLGFSIASLLAFGGVVGIALGFAAQSLVANLFGGITIYVSRPFKVGDSIIFPGTSLMGEVQEIGWRATSILGWNGKPFYVPNAKFNTETIINHSRIVYREISEYVYVRLQDIDKVPAIVEDANRMLEEHPGTGDYLVFRFDGYGDYALKLYLYAYTPTKLSAYTEYMRVKQDMLLKIAEIVAQHGAKLAVPVSNVYLPEGLALQREHGSSSTHMAEDG